MPGFPSFMKNAANRIASSGQSTPGIEGYVFDGADGSQMAVRTCREAAPHTRTIHAFGGRRAERL